MENINGDVSARGVDFRGVRHWGIRGRTRSRRGQIAGMFDIITSNFNESYVNINIGHACMTPACYKGAARVFQGEKDQNRQGRTNFPE
jgi:hypothetical protein